MNIKILRKRLVIAVGMIVILVGTTLYYSVSETTAAIGQQLISDSRQMPIRYRTAALTTTSDQVVMEWNQEAVTRILGAGFPAPRQMRAMAIVQVSVHDAVNGLSKEYETYLPSQPIPDNASIEGAAIAAAYTALRAVLPSQTPQQQQVLTQRYLDALAALQIATNDPGVFYGTDAALAILALRANDGNAQANCAYIDRNPDPGVWVRIINPATGIYPAASLPCFGSVTPWVIRSSTQFLPEPPPALDSERYAQDFNEVKSLGAVNSSTRTTEQTQIANFWNGSPTDIWNQVLRQVIASRDMDLSSSARAFALVYMTGTDASVSCWEAKYFYHTWRPVTAITRADEDGNPETTPLAGWSSYLPQYLHQHPEYPSGHSTNSGSLGAQMSLIFGDKPGVALTPTITGITREWESFPQAIDEVVDARVYSGIHFRTSDENGAKLGRQVAHFVFTHSLRPCKGKGSRCA